MIEKRMFNWLVEIIGKDGRLKRLWRRATIDQMREFMSDTPYNVVADVYRLTREPLASKGTSPNIAIKLLNDQQDRGEVIL